MDLATVDGFVAFDLDCEVSAGGTRLAPDVTREETRLLARAMTYKFAVLRRRVGGAKAALRAGQADRDAVLGRYCEEIRPLVARGTFLTSSDLGTRTQDFASLPGGDADVPMHREVGGVTLDAVVTGMGVVVAAETALGGLAGRSLAIEGFGKVGGAAAAEAVRRGARVVALSTVHGCVLSGAGLDLDRAFELRARHGDRWVEHAGLPVQPPGALFEADADVLVPGARTGVLDEARATRVRARIVAPAANVPYTVDGLEALRRRKVPALADFVCNAGATIGYTAPRDADDDAVRALVERTVRDLTEASMDHSGGPFAGACAIAVDFLASWRDPDGMPDAPPLAGSVPTAA